MNPHILTVIDNQLNPDKYTQEQLDENAADACVAYFAADAAADAAYAAANTAYYAAYADVDYWLRRYFKQTGENKQDYIDEINKDSRSMGRQPVMSVGYGAENKQDYIDAINKDNKQ